MSECDSCSTYDIIGRDKFFLVITGSFNQSSARSSGAFKALHIGADFPFSLGRHMFLIPYVTGFMNNY